MAFEWISEKASSVLNTVGEVGHSLLETAKGLVGAETKTEHKPETKAESKPEQKSENKSDSGPDQSLLDAARKQVEKKACPMRDAINSASSTITMVSSLTDALSKTDTSTLATGASLAGTLIAGPLAGAAIAGANVLAGLIKTGENSYESADHKIQVEKVKAEASGKLHEDFNSLWTGLDGQKPKTDSSQPLELSNVYEQKDVKKAVALLMVDKLPDQTHDHKDAKGNVTRTEIRDGETHVTKTDGKGNLLTEVTKRVGFTQVKNGGEVATRENNTTLYQSEGLSVTVDQAGNRKVSLSGDRELTRNADGSATLLDKKTGKAISLTNQQMCMMLDTNHSLTIGNQTNDLEEMTQKALKELKPGQSRILTIEGLGSRTVFQDGTIMDVRGDRTARIQTPTGQVFMLTADKQIMVEENGKFVKLNRRNLPRNVVQYAVNQLTIGNLHVDTDTMQMTAGNMTVDVNRNTQRINEAGQVSTITTNSNGTVKVETGSQTITNDGKAGVTITQKPERPEDKPATTTVNLLTQEIKTDELTDTPAMTVINKTGTQIKRDGSVHFDGGKGPTLYADGAVKVDDNTFIDKNNNVHSGDWLSQSGTNNAQAQVEKQAANMAAQASAIAAAVYGKAVVKWSDVQAIQVSMSDISSLLGHLPPDSPAFARLKDAYGQAIQVLAYASPRAEEATRQDKVA